MSFHIVEVVRCGVLGLRALLRHHADGLVRAVRVLDELQGGVAPDRDREDHAGVEDGVAESEDGEFVRERRGVHLALLVRGEEGDGLLGVRGVEAEGEFGHVVRYCNLPLNPRGRAQFQQSLELFSG